MPVSAAGTINPARYVGRGSSSYLSPLGMGQYDYNNRINTLVAAAGAAANSPEFITSAQALVTNSAMLDDNQFSDLAARTYGFSSASDVANRIAQFHQAFERGERPSEATRNKLQMEWDTMTNEERDLLRAGFGVSAPNEIWSAYNSKDDGGGLFGSVKRGFFWGWDHSLGMVQHDLKVGALAALDIANRPIELIQQGVNTLVIQAQNEQAGTDFDTLWSTGVKEGADPDRNRSWGNAWREAGKRERGYPEYVKENVRRIVNGDEDIYDLALEVAATDGATPVPDAIKELIRKKRNIGDDVPDIDLALDPEYRQRFSELYTKSATPEFNEAIGEFMNGKVSFGRYLARNVGIDPNPEGGFWSMWNFASGGMDMSLYVLDPLNWIGYAEVKAAVTIGKEAYLAGSLAGGVEAWRAGRGLVRAAATGSELTRIGRLRKDMAEILLHRQNVAGETMTEKLTSLSTKMKRRTYQDMTKVFKRTFAEAGREVPRAEVVTKKLTKYGKNYLRELYDITGNNRPLMWAQMVVDTFNRDMIDPQAIASLMHIADASGGTRLSRGVMHFAKYDQLMRGAVAPSDLNHVLDFLGGAIVKMPEEAGLAGVAANLGEASRLVVAQHIAGRGFEGGLRSLNDYLDFYEQADNIYSFGAQLMARSELGRAGHRLLERDLIQVPQLSAGGMFKLRSKLLAEHGVAAGLRAGSEFISTARPGDFANEVWFRKFAPSYVAARTGYVGANLVRRMGSQLPRDSVVSLSSMRGLEDIRRFLTIGLDSETTTRVLSHMLVTTNVEARREIVRNGIAEGLLRFGIDHTLIDNYIRSTGEWQKIYSYSHRDAMQTPFGVIHEALDESQALEDKIPLPHFRDLIDKLEKGTWFQRATGIYPNSKFVESFMRVWRPAVLIRFGFPIRAASEEAISWIGRVGLMTPIRSWLLDPLRDPSIADNEVPGLLHPLGRIERRTRSIAAGRGKGYKARFEEMIDQEFAQGVIEGRFIEHPLQRKAVRGAHLTRNGKIPFYKGDAYFVHEILQPRIADFLRRHDRDPLRWEAMRTMGMHAPQQNAELEEIIGAHVWERSTREHVLFEGPDDTVLRYKVKGGEFARVPPDAAVVDPLYPTKLYTHIAGLSHSPTHQRNAGVYALHISDRDATAMGRRIDDFNRANPANQIKGRTHREMIRNLRRALNKKRRTIDDLWWLYNYHGPENLLAAEVRQLAKDAQKFKRNTPELTFVLSEWERLSQDERAMLLFDEEILRRGTKGEYPGLEAVRQRREEAAVLAGEDLSKVKVLAGHVGNQYRLSDGLNRYLDLRRAYNMPDGRVVGHAPVAGYERIFLPTMQRRQVMQVFAAAQANGQLVGDVARQAENFARMNGRENFAEMLDDFHKAQGEINGGLEFVPIHLNGSLSPEFAYSAGLDFTRPLAPPTGAAVRPVVRLGYVDLPGTMRAFAMNAEANELARDLTKLYDDPRYLLARITDTSPDQVQFIDERLGVIDELARDPRRRPIPQRRVVDIDEPEALAQASLPNNPDRVLDEATGEVLGPELITPRAEPRKVLVAGSRAWTDRDAVWRRLDEMLDRGEIDVVISGTAKGPDTFAIEWAEARGIPVERYPADWKTQGRAAGGIRNQRMLDEGQPDEVIAFMVPEGSPGTQDMVRRAKAAGVSGRIIRPKGEELAQDEVDFVTKMYERAPLPKGFARTDTTRSASRQGNKDLGPLRQGPEDLTIVVPEGADVRYDEIVRGLYQSHFNKPISINELKREFKLGHERAKRIHQQLIEGGVLGEQTRVGKLTGRMLRHEDIAKASRQAVGARPITPEKLAAYRKAYEQGADLADQLAPRMRERLEKQRKTYDLAKNQGHRIVLDQQWRSWGLPVRQEGAKWVPDWDALTEYHAERVNAFMNNYGLNDAQRVIARRGVPPARPAAREMPSNVHDVADAFTLGDLRVWKRGEPGIPEGAVYVGRPTVWGNPHKLVRESQRDEVVELYRQDLLNNPELVARAKRELKGKHLICHCAPRRCHAEVLMEVANEVTPEIPIAQLLDEVDTPKPDSRVHAVAGATFLEALRDATNRNVDEMGELLVDQAGNVRYSLAVPIANKRWERVQLARMDLSAVPTGFMAPVYEQVPNDPRWARFADAFFTKIADPMMRSMLRNPLYKDLYLQSYKNAKGLLSPRLRNASNERYVDEWATALGHQVNHDAPHDLVEALDPWMHPRIAGRIDAKRASESMGEIPAILADVLAPVQEAEDAIAQLTRRAAEARKKGEFRRAAGFVNRRDQLVIAMDEMVATRSQRLRSLGIWHDNQKRLLERLDDAAHQATFDEAIRYVDDSKVRTQFGDQMRNFIPFWFAEEQFAKRWIRTFAEHDIYALHKIQLMHHALRSSGIVEKDDYGNDVYTLPFTGIAAKIMEKPMSLLFGSTDLPIGFQLRAELGASLPGIGDFPNVSWGPSISMPLTFLADRFPELQPIKRGLLGERGGNKGVLDQFLPSSLKRFYAALAHSKADPEFAGTMMNAMQLLEYNELEWQRTHRDEPETWWRYGLNPNANANEKADYIDRVRNWTHNALGVKAFLGLFSPGSPRLVHDDALQPEFREILNNVGNYEEAVALMVQRYPDASPFTLFQSESTSGAPLPASQRTYRWMKDNIDLLRANPEAGPWLIPQEITGSESRYFAPVYHWQVREGMRKLKMPDNFLDEMRFAEAAAAYFPMMQGFDEQLANAQSPEERRAIREARASASRTFLAMNPTFERDLGDPSRQQRRQRIITGLEALLLPGGSLAADPQYRHQRALATIFQQYQRAKQNSLSNMTEAGRVYRRNLTEGSYMAMQLYIQANPAAADLFERVYRPEFGLNEIEQEAATDFLNEQTSQNDPLLAGV